MQPALPGLLAAKRDGHTWASRDIEHIVRAVVNGTADPVQLGALLMAVRCCGMDASETTALTRAMADSGTRLQWGEGGPVVDKHSTGGVGDATSLILAPLLAACGARVPMVSGRGLGHTGGTLDKLEAIPGYTAHPSADQFHSVMREAGCAIVGATTQLAPADGILYAARNLTATADSIPLIVASILSKKLAAGIGTLLLDVKQGNGALLRSPHDVAALAGGLTAVGRTAGLDVRSLFTDMDQPLANAAGNALEVLAALEVLRGDARASRLRLLSLALAGVLLHACGLAASESDGREKAEAALAAGDAAQRFDVMQRLLGGPPGLLDRPHRHLPGAPCVVDVVAKHRGWLAGWDTRELGELVIDLGGGRRTAQDRVDPRVGLSALLPIGSPLEASTVIGRVHAANADAAAIGGARLVAALRVSERQVSHRPVVLGRVD
jgi:thymidine phosphorylase